MSSDYLSTTFPSSIHRFHYKVSQEYKSPSSNSSFFLLSTSEYEFHNQGTAVTWQLTIYQRNVWIEGSDLFQHVRATAVHQRRHYQTEVENDDVYQENYSSLHRAPFVQALCYAIALPEPPHYLVQFQNLYEDSNRSSFQQTLFNK